LHVPEGVSVKAVIHTARGYGIKEVYKVYQNSPAHTYVTDTIVAAHHTITIVAVTASTRLNGVRTKTVSGFDGQHLLVTIRRP
jgi:hypothetical protein